MNRVLRVGLLMLATAAASLTSSQAATLEQASPSVYWVKGDRPGAAISSVIVTSEGLVVVDATCRSEGTAAWLNGELKTRFKQPVKYVVLSHDHEDHICDLDVFDDTATTVSQVKTREAVVREKRNTSVPDITFEDKLSLWLGGKEIQLVYFGPTHSDNLIQVYVPDEKVLIAPDFMQRGQGLIPDFRDMDVDNMLKTWNYVYRMYDIDVIVNGHGGTSPKEDILNNIQYVQTLRQAVLDEMVKGASLQTMLETMKLPQFSGWRGYPQWLEADIVSMWDYLYRKREPNLGPAHDAWQNVVDKVMKGAAAANTSKE
ncbi:MAG TPA: MBL fold metallo-hydrolase [Steroidobacter sp.]|uniref:MBL fold metallo-hydrolase n=1 Tax=Steroidobacter sp. TaxID=1978227 RepID=UPI002ED9DD5C